MADEPDWAKLVEWIYQHDGWGWYGAEGVDPDDELIRLPEENQMESMAKRGDLMKTIETAQRAGFIDLSDRQSPVDEEGNRIPIMIYELTEKGFNVAHERELSKQQNKTNTALVVFTFTLVLVGLVGNYPDPTVQRWGSFLILGLLVATVFWTDILELPSP